MNYDKHYLLGFRLADEYLAQAGLTAAQRLPAPRDTPKGAGWQARMDMERGRLPKRSLQEVQQLLNVPEPASAGYNVLIQQPDMQPVRPHQIDGVWTPYGVFDSRVMFLMAVRDTAPPALAYMKDGRTLLVPVRHYVEFRDS